MKITPFKNAYLVQEVDSPLGKTVNGIELSTKEQSVRYGKVLEGPMHMLVEAQHHAWGLQPKTIIAFSHGRELDNGQLIVDVNNILATIKE